MKSLPQSRAVAVVAAAGVLALFTTGGAVAHGLVTSEDIKNETIAKRDIGPNAVGSGEVVNGTLDMADLNDTTKNAINSDPGIIYVDRILSTTSEAGGFEAARCPVGTEVITGFIRPGPRTAGYSQDDTYVDPSQNAWMIRLIAPGPDQEGSLRVRVVCLG